MVALFDNVTPFPVKQKDNEWYTPSRYVEAARIVMGGIDLDPASCEMANQLVRAPLFYTKEQNGLDQTWRVNNRPSKIWLNPPYGRTGRASNIGLFTKRLLTEYAVGNVEQAILLSTPRPDTPWFPSLWEHLICFVDRAIAFYWPVNGKLVVDNKHTGHYFGTIFVYLGPNEQKFIDIFSQFGTVAKRVSPARERPMPVRTLWDMEVQA